MIEQTEATAGGIKINEIWAYESPNHGDSAVINAGKLSEKCMLLMNFPLLLITVDLTGSLRTFS